MSKEMEAARRKFRRMVDEAGNNNLYGTIVSVDESSRTCNVQVGGVVYEGVLLYAIENTALKGMTPVPAKDSGVILGRIGSSNRRFVAMYSEIDKVLLTIGDKLQIEIGTDGMKLKANTTTLQATAGGFRMNRGGAGLKKTLGDLCDAIKAIHVPTGTGPSGTPINRLKFDEIKQGLNDYLE